MSGFVSFLIPPAGASQRRGAAAWLPKPTPVESPPAKGTDPEGADGGGWAFAGRAGRLRGAMEGGRTGGRSSGQADRTIRIGYHRLAQMTRLSWVSVKTNLRSLEKKLAIEVTGSENSATREGKCYRVYSRPAILERRKKAGLEWVRRSRGVELLDGEPICQTYRS